MRCLSSPGIRVVDQHHISHSAVCVALISSILILLPQLLNHLLLHGDPQSLGSGLELADFQTVLQSWLKTDMEMCKSRMVNLMRSALSTQRHIMGIVSLGDTMMPMRGGFHTAQVGEFTTFCCVHITQHSCFPHVLGASKLLVYSRVAYHLKRSTTLFSSLFIMSSTSDGNSSPVWRENVQQVFCDLTILNMAVQTEFHTLS